MDDADAAARLLYDFNEEYDDPTPAPAAIAARLRELIGRDDLEVLLAGDGPDAIAVVRYRPSIWARALECYLAELYVVPARRGQGLGRALMDEILARARRAGCDHVGICTSTEDTAACGLYESFGFTNREGGPDGPPMIYYELEL